MILLCSYGYVPWVYATAKVSHLKSRARVLVCLALKTYSKWQWGEGEGRESRQAAFRENELCK